MKRFEALAALAVAYLVLTAGVVWKFGPYGLMGSGALALLALTFVNPIDMPRPGKSKE